MFSGFIRPEEIKRKFGSIWLIYFIKYIPIIACNYIILFVFLLEFISSSMKFKITYLSPRITIIGITLSKGILTVSGGDYENPEPGDPIGSDED